MFNKTSQTISPSVCWNAFLSYATRSLNMASLKGNDKERLDSLDSDIKKVDERPLHELYELLVSALEENPKQDFLGDVYTLCGLNSKTNCQNFTPYPVSELMANITFANIEEKFKKQNIIQINDPTCGGGSLLVATRNLIIEKGLELSKVIFYGQDIDLTCVKMSFIQLSLLGTVGKITWGDTLTEPNREMKLIDKNNDYVMPMSYLFYPTELRQWNKLDHNFQIVKSIDKKMEFER